MSPKFRLPRIGRATGSTEADATTAAPNAPVMADPAAPSASQTRAAPDAATRIVEVSAEAGAPIAAGAAVETSGPAEPAATAATALEAGLAKMAGYRHGVLSWVADDGYPMNVDLEIEVKPIEGTVRFSEPPGFHIAPGTQVAITAGGIDVLLDGGFDGRRHVTLWGTVLARPRGRFALTPDRVWAWDAGDLPLPAAYERGLPKARRYFNALSVERGVLVRPKLSTGWLFFRATRAPFLSATLAPVLLGLAVALRVGVFDPLTAVVTLVAASAVHLGLNVANDVFDTLQGADDANQTPTKFSGGSRVLQNALVTIREMSLLAVGCYGVAAALGVVLFVLRGSPALVLIAALGFFISLAYTMPPLKLVYRGLGEIATLIGFGPVMLLGTYVVQSRGSLSLEAFLVSIPVALLVAMILYVNEIPDRAGDGKAGKRTLPVRWSKAAVIRGFDVAVGCAFVSVALSVAAGRMPIPTLLALLAIPLAMRVHSGLVRFYDNPYALMDSMAANIRLHMNVSLLLLVGYAITISDQTWLNRTPFFW
jgi:1,4-dihydroxy-2-naphthoate octaprenyltransferase